MGRERRAETVGQSVSWLMSQGLDPSARDRYHVPFSDTVTARKCQLFLGSLSHHTLLQKLCGLIYNIFQCYIFLVDVLVSFLPLG